MPPDQYCWMFFSLISISVIKCNNKNYIYFKIHCSDPLNWFYRHFLVASNHFFCSFDWPYTFANRKLHFVIIINLFEMHRSIGIHLKNHLPLILFNIYVFFNEYNIQSLWANLLAGNLSSDFRTRAIQIRVLSQRSKWLKTELPEWARHIH